MITAPVAITLAAFVPTICLSGRYSWRVSLAWGVALSVVAPIELIGLGPLLPANHAIRYALPAFLGALAFSEMYVLRASWPKLPRAYVMALLTFALAGVDVAAPFLQILGGVWIALGFTLATCMMIWAVALAPKGRVPWLLS